MKYAANRFAPTFQALDYNRFPPSVANLPAALTINGITVLPTFRYKGGDAGASTWKPWGYGEVLNIQILGDVDLPSLNQGSPMLGSFDDSVKFNDGAFYQGATVLAPGLNDFVVELLIKPVTASDDLIWGTIDSGVGDQIEIANDSTAIRTYVNGTIGNQALASAAITFGVWIHVLWFYDASGSMQLYINGVASGSSASVSGVVGSINTTTPQVLGGRYGGTFPFSGNVACLSYWQAASWLDTHLQATVATQRYAQLTKTKPVFSYSGVAALAVKGSATATYTQRFEGGINKLYYMGSTTPRWAEIIDGNGKQFRGMLNEVAATNQCLQSQTFATTWTPTRATVPATSVVCPDGITRTTNTLHEDATAGLDHFLYHPQITLTATQWVYSCFIKAANRPWAQLRVGDILLTAYFNLSGNGAVGTVAGAGTNKSVGIIPYGNGWYRCYATLTATAANHYHYIMAATGDNGVAFDGLNQDSIYIFGAQMELGNFPSSYIPTTTAAVTRTVDSNYYTLGTGDATPSQGTIYFEFWSPTLTPDSGRYLLALTDTTNNNHISLYLESGTGKLGVTSYSTGGSSQVASILTSTNKCDNLVHKVIFYWSLTSCTLMVDGVVVGTDATFDAPTALSRLNIGAAWNASLQSGPAIIGNIQIYPVPTTRIVYSSAADVNNAATYLIEA